MLKVKIVFSKNNVFVVLLYTLTYHDALMPLKYFLLLVKEVIWRD